MRQSRSRGREKVFFGAKIEKRKNCYSNSTAGEGGGDGARICVVGSVVAFQMGAQWFGCLDCSRFTFSS